MLSENINRPTINKNVTSLLHARKAICLEIISGETKYKFISRHKNARQNHTIQTAHTYLEIVTKFGNKSNKSKCRYE
jgi:hypothetical protein